MVYNRRQYVTAIAAGSATLLAGCGGSSDGPGGGTATGTENGGTDGQASGESYRFHRGNPERTAHFPNRSAHDEAISETWQTGIDGSTVYQPLVANGSIYVVSRDGDAFAISTTSQEQEWQTDVSDEISASPAVSGGTVYVPGDGGVLHALDATSGDQQWSYEIDLGNLKSPAVADGTVYLTAGISGEDRIAAIDADSGEEQWTEETSGDIRQPVLSDGTIYYVGGDGLSAIDTDGTNQRTVLEVAAGLKNLSADGNTVYAINDGTEESEYTERTNAELIAVDSDDRSERWRYEVDNPSIRDPATVDDNAVYVVSDDTLSKIAKDSGESEWTTSIPGGGAYTGAVLYGDTLYVTSQETHFTAIDKSDGSERWSTEFDVGTSEPVLVGGTVYLNVRSSLRAFE